MKISSSTEQSKVDNKLPAVMVDEPPAPPVCIPKPPKANSDGQELPEYSPPPGTRMVQPKVTRDLGRDVKGKILPHERDEGIAEKIAEWVAFGATVNEIAVYLNLRPGVIKKCYKPELLTGKFKNDMEVAGAILDLAKAGVPQMSIFYAKARMGWRDTDKNNSDNDAILNININI